MEGDMLVIDTPLTITEHTMRDLSALLGHLRAQEASLKAQLATLADKISALETTLQVAQELPSATKVVAERPIVTERPIVVEAPGKDARPLNTPSAGWARFLRGIRQIDALRAIASANDGVVRTADAKRIFLEAGLAKGAPKHVGPHIYHMLLNAEDFERIEPGTFRLTTMVANTPQDEDVLAGMRESAI